MDQLYLRCLTMTIDIVPVSSFPAQATKLRVDGGRVLLGEGASFAYQLLTAAGLPASPEGRVDLTPAQYAAWTGDDSFVAECVAENLGLTPA